MAKVDISKKKHYTAKDESHLVSETWRELAINVFVVMLNSASVWLLASLLLMAIHYSLHILIGPSKSSYTPWALVVTIISAAFIRALLIQLPSWRKAEGDGVSESINYFHKSYETTEELAVAAQKATRFSSFKRAFRKLIMTFLTVGTGGSGGVEGPILPIGEAIGTGWSALFKNRNPDNLRVFQMTGIAAGITTLLHAPLTGAVFAAEVVFGDHLIYRPLIYSLIASMVAFELSNNITDIEPIFLLHFHLEDYSLYEYLAVAAVAIFISAPAGLGISFFFRKLQLIFEKVSVLLRAPIGAIGALSIALGIWYFFGLQPYHILGDGEAVLGQLLYGGGDPQLQIWWVLFLLVFAKTLATGFTLMSGGSAGMLIPAMFMGGVSGAGIYQLLILIGMSPFSAGPDIFVISGIASALVAVIEVPLSAIILVMEIFGSTFGPAAIVAVVVTHKFVKRFKLYQSARG